MTSWDVGKVFNCPASEMEMTRETRGVNVCSLSEQCLAHHYQESACSKAYKLS